MCLIVFDWTPDSGVGQLRLVANRDEEHARPTDPLQPWPESPDIVAGRDRLAGGTWLGLSRHGRMAAVTNVREICPAPVDALSRGALVRDFLQVDVHPRTFLEALAPQASRYPGFNLLLLAHGALWHYSNRGDATATALEAGIHGISNAGLNTPWPKLLKAREALRAVPTDAPLAVHMDVLSRRTPFADDDLPDTGFGLSMERLLSPPFIVSPSYGTRCTTTLLWGHTGAHVHEQRYDATGAVTGHSDVPLSWTPAAAAS
ncbi:MAG: NRDE family protein [Oceanococcaceae bacterium]